MIKKLPIGRQDFISVREDGCSYVDKTARIYGMISGTGKAFFLSRPRRFGKSLLCSTLGAIFEGKRELFGEIAGRPALAINSLDWEWKKHPVIRLDLNPGDYSEGVKVLYSTLKTDLFWRAKKHGITLAEDEPAVMFKNLILSMEEKTGTKAVVIIDEYDKPLLTTIDKPELYESFRNALKGFFGVLKSCDEYLKFVFLTGVTKFAHVSIFSDLNHLKDLTLEPDYADICGITQEELEQNFKLEIESISLTKCLSREAYLTELRRFYNGYRFSRKDLTVYNTFGLLLHFDGDGEFLSYWYETGTLAFLLKLIENQKINILNLNNLRITYNSFSRFDVESMQAVPVLYQSGYLTISDYDEYQNQFILDYPNTEVRVSFAISLLEHCFKLPEMSAYSLYAKLPIAFFKGEVCEIMKALHSFFTSIPYDIIKEKENYYETAVHLIFTMLGFNCRSEVRISSGRIDTLVETKNFVYCFEFKLKGSVQQALKQIDSKEYLTPWKGSGKTLFKIGVKFDSKHHNIGAWKSVCVQ